MIFTEREIRQAIGSGQIVIDPVTAEERYSSTSVDLTLHDVAQTWQVSSGNEVHVSPGTPGYSYSNLRDQHAHKITIKTKLLLPPDSFVLGWTAETLHLPITSRVAARIEGKSGLARLGMGIHVTAPTIHSGFEGKLQLEICNHGPFWIELLPGMAICQVIFESTLGTPDEPYDGQFSQQGA